MSRTALITGASSGIGRDLARHHATAGGDLVLAARRKDRLQELARELQTEHDIVVTVVPCDLTADGAAEALYTEVLARELRIDYLINNAGFGGYGLFQDIEPRRHAAMIRLNVLALTGLTQAVLPDMLARDKGRILNVASTAAFVPGPLQAVYFATKAYVLSFTEAIARELAGTGVTATVLCPGATHTEFVARARLEGSRLFRGRVADSADVAQTGYRAMLRGQTRAIHGWQNRLLPPLLRLTPRDAAAGLAMRVMAKD